MSGTAPFKCVTKATGALTASPPDAGALVEDHLSAEIIEQPVTLIADTTPNFNRYPNVFKDSLELGHGGGPSSWIQFQGRGITRDFMRVAGMW